MLVINMNKKVYVYIAGFNQLWYTSILGRNDLKNCSQLRIKSTLIALILFQIIIVYFPPSLVFP